MNCSKNPKNTKLSHDSLATEEFKRKEYFQLLNLEQVRDRLKLRAQMFGNFKGSFPSKFRRQGTSLKCKLCETNTKSSSNCDITTEENIETQSHYLELCPLVSDLKELYNTESDVGIIEFFRAVVQRRAEIEDLQM